MTLNSLSWNACLKLSQIVGLCVGYSHIFMHKVEHVVYEMSKVGQFRLCGPSLTF